MIALLIQQLVVLAVMMYLIVGRLVLLKNLLKRYIPKEFWPTLSKKLAKPLWGMPPFVLSFRHKVIKIKNRSVRSFDEAIRNM